MENPLTHIDTPPLKLLGIGGSMRAESQSLAVLKHTLEIAAELGWETDLADVRALDLPLYNSDRQLADHSEALHSMLMAIRNADAYVICSPNYHGTITGAVKNLLDYVEFLGSDSPGYFGGKAVGVMGVGGGAANVLNSLIHAARALDGVVVQTGVGLPHGPMDSTTNKFSDESNTKRVQQMLNQLAALTRRLR